MASLNKILLYTGSYLNRRLRDYVDCYMPIDALSPRGEIMRDRIVLRSTVSVDAN